MNNILRIKNRELAEIVGEGIQLIQWGILTGFNFDKETTFSQLSLLVQYYHNVEIHILRVLEKIEETCLKTFGQIVPYERTQKWGLFKWNADFDDEPGNKYYCILSSPKFSLTRINFDEVKEKIHNELILAKDKSYLITFDVSEGIKARFLIDSIRRYCTKYIESGNKKNTEKIDDFVHAKPLFILRDDYEQVHDKNDLELVYRLELRKGTRIISSLLRNENLKTVLQKLQEFPCGITMVQEKRYVGKEFFKDY